MSKEKLISIIIPIFNVEQYIVECLESILSQTFCDYEIICIDDASTDMSYEILQKYIGENNTIKLLKNTQNRGLSYTRNRGLKEAKGKYIMFVDSDDMLQENSLEKIKALLEQYSTVDIIYYDMEIRNEGKWAKEQPSKIVTEIFEKNGEICTGQELFVCLQKKNLLIVEACRQIIKREFLDEEEITFYEGIYHEDNIFSFYCALNANKVVYVQEPFYIYRRRDSSIMSTMNLKRVQSFFIVFIELWNYWKNGIWSKEIDWLFETYLCDIYKQFVSKVNYYPNESLKYFGNSADQFMYKLMASNKSPNYEYVKLSEEQIRELEKASNIVIYGAGTIGIEVVRFLQSKNIALERILVSDKQSNPDEILGVPISEFGENMIYENTIIIVAILKKNEKALVSVTKNLKKVTKAKIMLYDGTIF